MSPDASCEKGMTWAAWVSSWRLVTGCMRALSPSAVASAPLTSLALAILFCSACM